MKTRVFWSDTFIFETSVSKKTKSKKIHTARLPHLRRLCGEFTSQPHVRCAILDPYTLDTIHAPHTHSVKSPSRINPMCHTTGGHSTVSFFFEIDCLGRLTSVSTDPPHLVIPLMYRQQLVPLSYPISIFSLDPVMTLVPPALYPHRWPLQ
jgi:hypothetical protein